MCPGRSGPALIRGGHCPSQHPSVASRGTSLPTREATEDQGEPAVSPAGSLLFGYQITDSVVSNSSEFFSAPPDGVLS
jgi:hypothetical protein